MNIHSIEWCIYIYIICWYCRPIVVCSTCVCFIYQESKNEWENDQNGVERWRDDFLCAVSCRFRLSSLCCQAINYKHFHWQHFYLLNSFIYWRCVADIALYLLFENRIYINIYTRSKINKCGVSCKPNQEYDQSPVHKSFACSLIAFCVSLIEFSWVWRI